MSIRKNHPFHIVNKRPWPLTGAIGAIVTVTGLLKWFHRYDNSLIWIGAIITSLTIIQCWQDVTREGTYQTITHKVTYKISKISNNSIHCLRNPILRIIFLTILPYKIITNNWTSINLTTYRNYGPGSVVSIATGCGLNGPGIQSRWGRDFPHLSRPALGPTQPPAQWAPGLSRR